MSKRFIF